MHEQNDTVADAADAARARGAVSRAAPSWRSCRRASARSSATAARSRSWRQIPAISELLTLSCSAANSVSCDGLFLVRVTAGVDLGGTAVNYTFITSDGQLADRRPLRASRARASGRAGHLPAADRRRPGDRGGARRHHARRHRRRRSRHAGAGERRRRAQRARLDQLRASATGPASTSATRWRTSWASRSPTSTTATPARCGGTSRSSAPSRRRRSRRSSAPASAAA